MGTRGARTTLEGTAAGVLAAAVFIVAEMVASRGDVYAPLRRFASVLLGRSVLDPSTQASLVATWGILVSFTLAAGFGTAYGWLLARVEDPEAHSDPLRQMIFGVFFGAIVWTVNWQILARFFWPWLLRTPQFTELSLHALFFGMPLALFYALIDRSYSRHPLDWI